MSERELRELDAWIAEHVMGKSQECRMCGRTHYEKGVGFDSQCNYANNYTTDPAAAMEVLSKCTEKLGMFEHISINHAEGEFAIRMAHAGWDWIWAETLPLAICLFAKKLFTK